MSFDGVEGLSWDVLAGGLHGDAALFRGVLELVVTAFTVDLEPAVPLELRDHLSAGPLSHVPFPPDRNSITHIIVFVNRYRRMFLYLSDVFILPIEDAAGLQVLSILAAVVVGILRLQAPAGIRAEDEVVAAAEGDAGLGLAAILADGVHHVGNDGAGLRSRGDGEVGGVVGVGGTVDLVHIIPGRVDFRVQALRAGIDADRESQAPVHEDGCAGLIQLQDDVRLVLAGHVQDAPVDGIRIAAAEGIALQNRRITQHDVQPRFREYLYMPIYTQLRIVAFHRRRRVYI